MIMNHYPLDEQYQFLPNNVEIDTFKSLPLNGAGFGKYNVQSFFPRNGLISETQDSIKIRFEFEKSPKQVFLQFDRKMTGYSLEIIDDKISFDLEWTIIMHLSRNGVRKKNTCHLCT